MIDWYPVLKLIHIMNVTILFGTGIGIATFSLWAHMTNDVKIIAHTFKKTVLADLIFTTPAIVIQPISGLLLVYYQGYDLFETWLSISYILYIIAGLCWLPVVWLQIQIRNIAHQTLVNKSHQLPDKYYKFFYIWFILGWPAFIGLMIVFALMIYKPNF
jgi:uncharacterized membrane protein